MEISNVLKSHLSATPVIVICTKKDKLINELKGKALDKVQETGTVTILSQLANQAYAQAEAAIAIDHQGRAAPHAFCRWCTTCIYV